MKKTVCVPATTVYAAPELLSEQTDEMLFGECCEVLSAEGAFSRIRTEYGYEGFVETRALCDELHAPNRIVCVPFADLLPENRNFSRPMMTLPRGSRVDVGFSDEEPRYGFAVLPSKRIWYIHKSHVRPLGKPGCEPEELRERIRADALSYLGVQYRWGGRTPAGVDCSGLCFTAYRLNGLTIWRDASPEENEKRGYMIPVPIERAHPGDLLFFPGHVAMLLGEDRMVHASASAGKVEVVAFDAERRAKLLCAMAHRELE